MLHVLEPRTRGKPFPRAFEGLLVHHVTWTLFVVEAATLDRPLYLRDSRNDWKEMALREENFVVLHSGSWNTKAGINVVDTNKPPVVVWFDSLQLLGKAHAL